MVFYVPKAPLNDFCLGVFDYGVCHVDAQPLEHRGHLKALLAVFGFLLSVAQAAYVVGQELAAIVNVNILRDAVFQDALAQRHQGGLAAGGRGDVAPSIYPAPGVKEGRKVQTMELAVLALSDNVKGVVVRHPPLIAGHFLI